MAKEMSIFKRIFKEETPKFFKRVRTIALSLSLAATAIISSPSVVDGLELPDIIITICKYLIVAGVAISATATTASSKR